MPTNDNERTIAWKPKRLLDESIKPLTTEDTNLATKLKWIYNSKIVT